MTMLSHASPRAQPTRTSVSQWWPRKTRLNPIAVVFVAIAVLRDFAFEREVDGIHVRKEPIGVVAAITPWNWPLYQITAKVAPALAAGDTMILKPSEESPGCAVILAEMLTSGDKVEDVLPAFMARRFPRVKMVLDNSLTLAEWEIHPETEGADPGRIMGQTLSALVAPA